MTKTKPIRTFTELSTLKTFNDRYMYLRLQGTVGADTFGFDRYLNQILYKSKEWISVRNKVIIRDEGHDLGLEGYEILGPILIHHMNPLTKEDILNRNPDIFNPEYLISSSHATHNAIHYGDETFLNKDPISRHANDTCPWRAQGGMNE